MDHDPIEPNCEGSEAGKTGNLKTGKLLSSAAQRALAEARERRLQQQQALTSTSEIGGRGGQDPARYGDWEVKGRAIDF